MEFNDKLTLLHNLLDNSHDSLLENLEIEDLLFEKLESEVVEDRKLNVKLALIYAEDHETTVPTLPFREWAREQLRRERNPEYTKAWEEGE